MSSSHSPHHTTPITPCVRHTGPIVGPEGPAARRSSVSVISLKFSFLFFFFT